MKRLFFTGDIVIHKSTNFIDQKLQSLISQHDYIIGNLEAPIINESNPIDKAGPTLKQGKNAIQELNKIGFSHFTLANNHIFDFGKEGLKSTITSLEKNNMAHCGAHYKREKVYDPLIISSTEGEIALFSFSEAEFGTVLSEEDSAGYGYINHQNINQLISESKKKYDIVIIAAHVGIENIDIPIPIWKERFKKLIELGADLIIGHHPHVPQGYEEYMGKHIFYSLGNFYMDYGKYLNKEYWSYSVSISIENKNIVNFHLIPHIKGENKLTYFKKGIDKIQHLNTLLSNDYTETINKTITQLYKDIYKHDIIRTIKGYSKNDSWIKRIRRIIAIQLLKKKNEKMNGLIQYHLFLKDSHRYVITQALKLKFINNK